MQFFLTVVVHATDSMMKCARELRQLQWETELHSEFYSCCSIPRERDEMCERVAALTAQNQALSQREEELYQQVKRSIALVEQAQLEQTEVGLKCCNGISESLFQVVY